MTNSILWEWSGSTLSILGALLLATHTKASRYGWLAFLAANIVLLAYFANSGLYGLVVQQIAFTGTSVLGIWWSGLLAGFRLNK